MGAEAVTDPVREPILSPIARVEASLEWARSSQPERLLWRAALDELRVIESGPGSAVHPGIGYVLVLSGRSNFLKEPVDSPEVLDRFDDFNRMTLGIRIAREAAAMTSGIPAALLEPEEVRRYGPVILYNGRDSHNRALRTALETGLIDNYPPDCFRILELPPGQQNSKGHFSSLAEHHPIESGHVAIVTHAFHFPRVVRMVGRDAPVKAFGPDVRRTFYLADRTFAAPGAEADILGELGRIPRYVASGDLREIPDPLIDF